jgi:hypothetical protein
MGFFLRRSVTKLVRLQRAGSGGLRNEPGRVDDAEGDQRRLARKTSKIAFSAGAGGELDYGVAGKLTATGKFMITGYGESELTTVANPRW